MYFNYKSLYVSHYLLVLWQLLIVYSILVICIHSDLGDSCLRAAIAQYKQQEIKQNRTDAIVPSTDTHKATIIFLHGLGGTGHRWVPMLELVRQPSVKIFCPTADAKVIDADPRGIRELSWYNMTALLQDAKYIENATKYIHHLIDEERIKHGIKSDHIILGGITQGGVLALNAALTYPKPLAGVASFCSYLPIPLEHALFNRTNITANRNIPILHCDYHPVPIFNHQKATEILKNISNNVDSRWYGVGTDAVYLTEKVLPQEGIDDFREFCNEHLRN